MYVGSIQYGGIETFCLLRYGNILSPKLIKILNYNFMQNWLKYFDKKKSDKFYLKMVQYSQTEICPKRQNILVPPCRILLTKA